MSNTTAAHRSPWLLVLTGLLSLVASTFLFTSPAGAHFAGVDDSTGLICDGETLVLSAAAVSWMEDMTGEHPRIIIEMRTDISDWVTVAVGPFSADNGYRISGSAVVPEGATFVDVRVSADASFPWGDSFSAPTPPAERRLTVVPGENDCSAVAVPTPTPTPTPPPAEGPTGSVSCVGDVGDRLALMEASTTSVEPQDVAVLVDGLEVTTLTVSDGSPATFTLEQDPGETNSVELVHDGDVIAAADVQCVDGEILPPTPEPEVTPTPGGPVAPPEPPGPELPATGSQSESLALSALALIGGGLLMLVGGGFLRRRAG